MLCPKCGHSCKSGVLFCEICGVRLPDGREHPDRALPPPGVRSRVLRSGFSSPIALIMLTAYSIAAVCNLVAALRIPMYIRESLRSLIGFMGAGDGRFEPFATYYSIALLVTFLPGLLIAVGSWVTFLSAAFGTGRMKSAAGLQLVSLGLVAELTLRCVNFGWLGYVFLASNGNPAENPAYSYLYGYSFTGSILLQGTALLSGILMFALLSCYIVYYRKAIKQVWHMRISVETGIPSGRVSRFLVFFAFAMGLLAIPDAFLLPDALIAVTSFFGAAARICAGVLLLVYRSNMQTLYLEKQTGSAPSVE